MHFLINKKYIFFNPYLKNDYQWCSWCKKTILFFTFFLLKNLLFAQSSNNVILIIADDLGTDYLGFYENHQDTAAMPNIRKLLKKGVRFRRAWSNPLCSPTRSGILTGRYSFRTGVGTAIGGPTSAVLDTAEVTIPRLLNKFKPNQIAKATIGKWHLHTAMPASNLIFPNKMGYDHFEGNFLGMIGDYYNWMKCTNGVNKINTNYATSETVDNAITWAKQQQNKPFFLWLAFNAPHSPHHLPPLGLHSYLNLVNDVTAITANPKPYFKAMVEAMDHEIGRLFDSLAVTKQLENTDIIFIGDNGNESSVAQNVGGSKGSLYQEGVNVPFIISGPSIVQPNRVSDALVNTQDLFATILELFGHTAWQNDIPTNKPVDSKSVLPILKNQSTSIRDWVFTEVFRTPSVAGDGKAMRNDEYKLLDFDNGTQKFFNLKNDPTENTDLLKKTLSGGELSQYNYLCTEMANLTGKTGFCNTVSTNDPIDLEKHIKVFPNPFTNFIHLSPSFEGALAILSNVLGQVIYTGRAIEQQDFSSLSKGIYFLTLEKNKVVLIKTEN